MFQIVNVWLIILCFMKNFDQIYSQDVSVIINTKRSLHIVDERFISIVIDPMILITGLNISTQTLNLAKHFSPALIRIHGPSSSRLSFSDHDTDPSANMLQAHVPDFSSGGLTVTPSMWTSLNEWIISANLTPVYALNNRDRVNDAWNPKATALPLMELTDKMNITCYWELANDTPNKTLKQYASDVTSLRHILDAFPASRNSWGTVAEDFNQCVAPEDTDVTRKLVEDIEAHVNAVNWISKSFGTSHFERKITKLTPFTTKYGPAVWTTAPRSPKPTSFKDGLLWAKYLGHAAIAGYDVIFRQPKIKELFEITPAYWVSLFHKSLMGRNVLDVRSSGFNMKDDCYIYAHCSKKQNRFTRRGAATILAINMEKEDVNASVKLMGAHIGNLEIQSYVLTAPSEDSSDIYLNGHLLTISDLQDSHNEFMPKIRRTRASTPLILTLPPKSIGFFVMPNAQLSTCIRGEDELHHIREEILKDQNENVWKDETVELERGSDTMTSMNELYMMMEDLLESNEKYYKNPDILKQTKEWKKLLLARAKEAKKGNKEAIPMEGKPTATIPDDVRKIIINRAKLVENQKNILEIEKRKLGLRHLLLDRSRVEKLKPKDEVVLPTDLELSSSEINRILADREKIEVEENKKNTETKVSKKDEELIKLNENAGELLKQFSAFKNKPGNSVSRKKRNLQFVNEEQNIQTSADVNDIENGKVSNIIEPANTCNCRKSGKCTCGLAPATNLIKKIWEVPEKLLNGNINNVEMSDGFNSILDEYGHMKNILEEKQEPDDNGLTDQDMQEMKKMLSVFHNEVKTIVALIRDTDTKRTNIIEEDKIEANHEPAVYMQRKRRDLFENLKEKHRQGRQKLKNIIKSRKNMYDNRIKERNAMSKHGQRFRRIKRETDVEKEKNENKIGETNVDNVIVQPISKTTVSGAQPATESSTKSPIVGSPRQQKQNSSKIKTLNRRLIQQKRLEERIAAYLGRIKESNRQLTKEIQRSARSIREVHRDSRVVNEHQENVFYGEPNYFSRFRMSVDPKLVNPLQNTIQKEETDNLLFDILKRQQSSLIDIRKREIVHDYINERENKIIDHSSKNVDDNRTTKWNYKNVDERKEDEIIYNEISKEDNMIKPFRDNVYEEYMTKPKIYSNKYKDLMRKKSQFRNNKLKEEIKMEKKDNINNINRNYSNAEMLFNEIPKEDKFLPAKLRNEELILITEPKLLNTDNRDLEQNKILKEENTNKSEDEYGTKSELTESSEILNTKIPINQNICNNAYEIVPPYPNFDLKMPHQETTINGYNVNAQVSSSTGSNQIQNNEIYSKISKQNGEMPGSVSNEEIVSKPKNKVHKDGLVDNVFETMFGFLNDFHKTIVDYLKYLAP